MSDKDKCDHHWVQHAQADIPLDILICEQCNTINWPVIEQQLYIRDEAARLRVEWAAKLLLRTTRVPPYGQNNVLDVVQVVKLLRDAITPHWRSQPAPPCAQGNEDSTTHFVDGRIYPLITDQIVLKGPIAARIAECAHQFDIPGADLAVAVQQANRLDASMGTERGVNIIAHALTAIYGHVGC